MAKKEIFSVDNGKIIKKGNVILEDLSLRVFEGEITGIVFDSILEQRAFLKFLTGEILPESGSIYIYGKQLSLQKALNIFSSIVSVIGIQSNLIDSLTVEENVFLFSDKKKIFSEKEYKYKLVQLLEKFQIRESVSGKVKNLTVKQKVVIELLKAYVEMKKIVVLNGIASVLSEEDMEEIFCLISRMKEGMAFLVTVGFEETVVKWSDMFAVIQNGKTTYMGQTDILNKKLSDILKELLLEHTDRDYTLKKYQNITEQQTREIFRAEKISTGYLKNLNFSVCTGEVLKIYCADEESKKHLWEMFAGETYLTEGKMFLEGKEFCPFNMAQSVKQGIGFISEAPYRTMMMENLSVLENLSIPLDEKISGFWWFKKYMDSVWRFFPQIRSKREKVKDMDNEQLQRMIYEKWSLYLPKVLIVENPFSDMDVNMREVTVNMLENLREKGISIIILTSNISTMKKIRGQAIYLKKGKIREEI